MSAIRHIVGFECDGCGKRRFIEDVGSSKGWSAKRISMLVTLDYCPKCTREREEKEKVDAKN
jgi:hypothetical protein